MSVKVPEVNILPLPEGMAFEAAAAIPLTFLTAWNMLVTLAKVRTGEDVLVMGAGSGVGSAAVQIAKLFGEGFQRLLPRHEGVLVGLSQLGLLMGIELRFVP